MQSAFRTLSEPFGSLSALRFQTEVNRGSPCFQDVAFAGTSRCFDTCEVLRLMSEFLDSFFEIEDQVLLTDNIHRGEL